MDAVDAVEILDLLARYAHVIDNRDWSEADTVFAPDVRFGRDPVVARGIDELTALMGDEPGAHGHNTTDVLLDLRADGTVRAWSKFFIVRGDGTLGSGDYRRGPSPSPAGSQTSARVLYRAAIEFGGSQPQSPALVEGTTHMSPYMEPEDRAYTKVYKQTTPDILNAFNEFNSAVFAEEGREIPLKYRELIAVAVAL
ncbi:MAG: carboxymuconolactone decarboxylase family protein, partial [Pseudonocardiales bacterium]|nr:carboxymuconolactone decarboxylase family protein [Pseudonocardiales bacterium]